MTTESSIRFDVGAARLLAKNRGWTLQEWAKQANTTNKTLAAFLNSDPRLKLSTIEQILKPLGIFARDILAPREPETVTK